MIKKRMEMKMANLKTNQCQTQAQLSKRYSSASKKISKMMKRTRSLMNFHSQSRKKKPKKCSQTTTHIIPIKTSRSILRRK